MQAVDQEQRSEVRASAGPPWWALPMPRLWAVVAVSLAALEALLTRPTSVDLAYHIRLGEMILDSGSIPAVDTFSYTMTGSPWLDQQWGAQIPVALAYRAGGWAGETILRAGLITLTFLFVYLACRAAGAKPRTSALLTIASLLAILPGLALRPQLFAMALLAATTWVIAGRRRHPHRVLILPFLVLAWANLHGSFVLAPALLLLAWIEDGWDRQPEANRSLWIALACVLAATVNPFGLEIWLYVVELSTNETIRETVSEWAPPSIRDYGGAAFFASVAAVAGYLALRGRKTAWPRLLTLGVFLALGLAANRAVLIWALVVPVIVASELARGADEQVGAKTARPRRTLNTGIGAAMLALVVLALPGVARPLDAEAWLPSDIPLALNQRIHETVDSGDRLFAPQAWGSWFELTLPGTPVFIDSRIELFPERTWNEYHSIMAGREGWQELLDHHQVDVVALEAGTAGLLPRISQDAGWREVYRDGRGVLFLRSLTA